MVRGLSASLKRVSNTQDKSRGTGNSGPCKRWCTIECGMQRRNQSWCETHNHIRRVSADPCQITSKGHVARWHTPDTSGSRQPFHHFHFRCNDCRLVSHCADSYDDVENTQTGELRPGNTTNRISMSRGPRGLEMETWFAAARLTEAFEPNHLTGLQ